MAGSEHRSVVLSEQIPEQVQSPRMSRSLVGSSSTSTLLADKTGGQSGAKVALPPTRTHRDKRAR